MGGWEVRVGDCRLANCMLLSYWAAFSLVPSIFKSSIRKSGVEH